MQIGVEELAGAAADFSVWLMKRLGVLTPERAEEADRQAKAWA